MSGQYGANQGDFYNRMAAMGAGAGANPDAYSNMARLGVPMAQAPSSSMFGVSPVDVRPQQQGQPFDLKSPLAGFAMNMAMQQMQPRQAGPVSYPQHVMGLQMPRGSVQNPYGRLA